jgi:hypothetical protein
MMVQRTKDLKVNLAKNSPKMFCLTFSITIVHYHSLLENNCSRCFQNGLTTHDICSMKDTNLSLPNLLIDDGMDRCSIGSRSSCVSPVSSQGGVYTVI